MSELLFILYFIAGLIFGSFANVLIHRIPKKMSIISPGSFCPVCETSIKWFDNIPVISWVLLGGKCRDCKTKISTKYPMVELTSGALFAVAFVLFGATVKSVLAVIFLYVLLIVSFIDAELRIIPNAIVYPAAGLTIFALVAFKILDLEFLPLIGDAGLLKALLAAFSSAFLMAFFDWLGKIIFKKQGIGAGDVKLSFLMGLYLGYYVFFAILVSFFIGAIFGAILIYFRKRKGLEDSYMPLGPFLALASLVTLFIGKEAVALYASFIS